MDVNEYKIKFPNERIMSTSQCVKTIKSGMLLFNDESAPSWGASFEGNYAYFSLMDFSSHNLKTEREIRQRFRFSHHSIPYGVRPWNGPANDEQHLQKRLKMLNRKDLIKWQETQNKFYIDQPTIEKPIRLRMCGNDDTSYSKFYSNVESALDEIAYFEIDEPLDINDHIRNNGFVFTN